LHLYNAFMPTMQKGDILGHEFMGEVVEVGKGVGNLRVGDRVVVPFAIACGNCESCELGNFSCCENANPNGWMAEKLMGHATCGAFGYSHLTGGFAGDKVKQTLKMQMDRPLAVRDAIMACRNGGIVSILGVYAGLVDKFPLGPLMNRGLTIKTG